ncbi:MAG: glycosyltransferase family 39 protein [Sumerlaeia bacterium]
MHSWFHSEPAKIIRTTLILGAAYLLFGIRSQTEDANSYLVAIETGKLLWNPHHILYNPLMRAFWLAATFFLESVRSYHVVYVVNAFISGLAVTGFLYCCNALRGNRVTSFIVTLLFAFSPAWVRYVTVAEVYHAAICCVIWGIYFWIRARDDFASVRMWFLSGALIGLGGLFHQTVVLAGLGLMVATLLTWRRDSYDWRMVVAFAAGGIVVAGGGSILGAIASGHYPPVSIWEWLTAMGRSNAAWGRIEHFSGDWPSIFLGTVYQTIWAFPFKNSLLRFLFLVPFAVLIAIGIWKDRENRTLHIGLSVWCLMALVFAWWWVPWNREFVLLPMVAILLSAGASLGLLEQQIEITSIRWIVAVSLGLLVLLAFPFLIWKEWRPNTEWTTKGLTHLGTTLAATEGEEDHFLIADYAAYDVLYLYYPDDVPEMEWSTILTEEGAARVTDAIRQGRIVIVDAYALGAPFNALRDPKHIGGMDPQVRATRRLLAALSAGRDLPTGQHPVAEPVEVMEKLRAYRFAPGGPSAPAPQVYERLHGDLSALPQTAAHADYLLDLAQESRTTE